MNLRDDASAVTGVLLANGWHFVVPGSFKVQQQNERGRMVWPDASLTFTFEQAAGLGEMRPSQITGPLASVLAVRHG